MHATITGEFFLNPISRIKLMMIELLLLFRCRYRNFLWRVFSVYWDFPAPLVALPVASLLTSLSVLLLVAEDVSSSRQLVWGRVPYSPKL